MSFNYDFRQIELTEEGMLCFLFVTHPEPQWGDFVTKNPRILNVHTVEWFFTAYEWQTREGKIASALAALFIARKLKKELLEAKAKMLLVEAGGLRYMFK